LILFYFICYFIKVILNFNKITNKIKKNQNFGFLKLSDKSKISKIKKVKLSKVSIKVKLRT